ncbi:hypothetical protein [Levilactobacillus suantsaii]|uniref:Uncharacterized protein n=1 Tax=Levilactobacillus suantsaii TaxID=2292255 RepID=A0A4Q0VIL4_9LACO|nr:hypothetical protein [Levilactobacillus suantsaii]QMU08262.1 hypothetical protein H3M12_00855 [Levilactobacillus suantsaii]RXI76553.1 hypothetical protein DXH47_10390 [Levilactobacillus suantsaii]
MEKLHLSRFTTRILLGWCLLLAVILVVLGSLHAMQPHLITLHALTLDGFLASALMGLRLVVLFLVFSTIPMRWPVTLLSFLSLTIGIVALYQLIPVMFRGPALLALVYLAFVASMLGLLFTAILTTSETITRNDWAKGDSYFKHWGLALLSSIRDYSLPLLVSLIVFSLSLALTNSVTF